ncbi:LPXTG cell wall anchor domain-containing protein [Streptomyces sp. NPDC005908]|uniref:LPXTG cell wall anchor domain-containing protein n=1 Tax=Streptomyces sp. NPDC005908 TaxID=3157084 RepID=UPI00340E6DED
MTKKTRIRVARIAAGAVIAAGASLTAAGAASALEIGVSAEANDAGLGIGLNAGDDDPEPGGDEPTTTPPTELPTEEPTTEEPTEEPTTEEPTEEPSIPTEPTEPTEDPTEDPTEAPSESAPGGGLDPDGGASPQEEGSSSLTDTGEEVPAASAQGSGKELAETGAAETTFLVIGAATMIAGGIGFRVLPRLMTGRGGAAA